MDSAGPKVVKGGRGARAGVFDAAESVLDSSQFVALRYAPCPDQRRV